MEENDVVFRIIARVLGSGLDLQEIIDLSLGLVVEATGAERGFLVLLGEGGEHECRAAVHLEDRTIDSPGFEVSRGLIDEVAGSGRSVLIDDALLDDWLGARSSVQEIGLRSALVVALPGVGRTGVAGVLYLDDRARPRRFGEGGRRLVEALAGRLAPMLENSRSETRLRREAREGPPAGDRFGDLLGRGPRMREVFALLERLAPTDVAVLVEGESGTGKEVVSRALHAAGPRAGGPFVVVDCPALVETLLEVELFGVVRGAYTGADRDRDGLLARADGGTLFLDGACEMSPALQARLLRALEEGVVRPVGSIDGRPFDARVVTAARRSLAGLCSEGRFREDLYFRLAAVRIELPPLRERPEDIEPLAARFLGRRRADLSAGALERLVAHRWPGNVRELQAVLERARLETPSGPIPAEALSPGAGRQPGAALLRRHPDLSHREWGLLEYLEGRGAADAAEVERALGASRSTALRTLGRLVERGLVRRVGQGRAARYARAESD